MAFTPGISGNPNGRPKGRPDKRTRLREQLTAKGGALLTAMIAKAEGGDVDAQKFLLSRLIPPARDLPVTLDATDAPLAQRGAAILAACFAGRLTPEQSASLMSALKLQGELELHTDLAARVEKLEIRIREHRT